MRASVLTCTSQEVKVQKFLSWVWWVRRGWFTCSPGRQLQCLNIEMTRVAGLLSRGGKSRAALQGSVALGVRQGRVVLPVADVGERQADGGSSQDIWRQRRRAPPQSRRCHPAEGAGPSTLLCLFSRQNPSMPGLSGFWVFLILSYSCGIVIVRLFSKHQIKTHL